MLCVLREDFLLELYGITNDRIDRLDDNDPGFRRTYFWRNSLRTLEAEKSEVSTMIFGCSAGGLSSEPPRSRRNDLRDRFLDEPASGGALIAE